MQPQTILNRVARYKSGVYSRITWDGHAGDLTLRVEVDPRANGRPICSGRGKRPPGYDRLAERQFEFVPLWQIAVVFVYALRRVDCPTCGVVVERVPWSEGKSRLTTAYQWFPAGWARRRRAYSECSAHTSSSRITRPSSSPMIRSSRRKCGTSSGGAWCSATCAASRPSASTRFSGGVDTIT